MPPSLPSSTTASVLPESPPGEVTAGLDWATADHAVAIVNSKGTVLEQFLIDVTGAGLHELVRRLRRAGVGEVAIERGDGQVVDSVLDAGLTVVVISPNQVHNLRGRYGSAGNKNDRFDAFVLADTLRTDRARLRPLIPDTAATIHLRSAVRARKDLITHRVGLANQLHAHLRFFHPGPAGLFADLGAVTSLRFLGRFTSQDDADWLTPSRLATWLRSVAYTGRKDPTALHAHLRAAAPGATGPAGAAAAAVTSAFVAALITIVAQIHALDGHIAALLDEHVDAHIFLSLPRAQALRAARLLAEIGDCRARFPTPESLASLAGVTPSTRQSGKMKTTSFRWSADQQLRDAVCDFAADSRHANPWAAQLYDQARARGHRHPTPSGSSPGPGCTSSGGAGRTTSPTTPPATAHSRPSSTSPSRRRRSPRPDRLRARPGSGSARPPEGSRPARAGALNPTSGQTAPG